MGHPGDTPLQTAFRTPEFWRCYVLDETDGFDVDAAGKRLAEELGGTNLDFPVGSNWFLRLHLAFQVNLFTLYLCDSADSDDVAGGRLELGHWDQARAHPFCLRWDELEAVIRRMRAEPDRLGLFHGDAAERIVESLLMPVSEDDYAWRWDAEAGWTFGGEYSCYSNRNDDHRFPFAEFRRLLGIADEPASAH